MDIITFSWNSYFLGVSDHFWGLMYDFLDNLSSTKSSNGIKTFWIKVELDCSQSIFYFVPQDSHGQDGSSRLNPLVITNW